MKFVFICDEQYTKTPELQRFLENFPKDHELVVFDGKDLLEQKQLPACDALIAERRTWQRYFSLYRYFDVLELLESIPVGIVIRKNMVEKLKGRHRIREVVIPLAGSTEDILSALDKLLANSKELTGLTPIKAFV